MKNERHVPDFKIEKCFIFLTHGFSLITIFVCIASCVVTTAGAKAEDETGSITVLSILNIPKGKFSRWNVTANTIIMMVLSPYPFPHHQLFPW